MPAQPRLGDGKPVDAWLYEEAARMWAGKIAEACGWPQEVRRFGRSPQPGDE
jgi:hypothetical protein